MSMKMILLDEDCSESELLTTVQVPSMK